MRLFVLFLILFSSQIGVAQFILVKNDGVQIPYKKIRPLRVSLELVLDNKEHIKVPKKDVVGYYDVDLQKMFYVKPVVKNNENILVPLVDEDTVNGIQFLEKVIVGKITLYKKEVIKKDFSSGMSTYNSDLPPSNTLYPTNTYYYAEKDDLFENVLITGLNSKKDDLMAFRRFVEDDKDISALVEGDNFSYNEAAMLKILNNYNLKFFNATDLDNSDKTGSVMFYSKAGQKRKRTIVLTVNDSIEYKWPDEKKLLPIKLPLNAPSKICVRGAEGTTCRLIQPISFTANPYELDYLDGEKVFVIENRSAFELKTYLRLAQ